jgi:hypothetical protein
MPYWEANQRLALDWARLNQASPGSSPTPLEVGVEWHYSFGLLDPFGCPASVALENHQGVLSQPGICDAQGQSLFFCCVDRGAAPGAGDEGDASVHPGLDGALRWMVHCFSSCTLSFSAEASCHQPLSSVRFYLIIWAGDIYRFSNAKAWDDFDDGQPDGWTAAGGTWGLEDGELSASSPYEDMQAYPDSASIKNGSAEVKIKFNDELATEWAGIHVRKTYPSDSYMSSGYMATLEQDGRMTIYKAIGGEIAYTTVAINPASFNTLRFDYSGENLKVYLNGTLQLETNDSTFSQGYVGLWSGMPGSTHNHFDDFKAVAAAYFVSSVFDGGDKIIEHQFLISAEKTSHGPNGATIDLEVRSSVDSDMNDPTEWIPVDWGDVNELELLRYVQFRLLWKAPLTGLLTNFGLSNITLVLVCYDALNGTFISNDLDANRVFKATASWNCELNGQTINVSLSNDGGNSWHLASNGVAYTFDTVGEPLKYKLELAAANISQSPVLYDISIAGSIRKYPMNPSLDIGADDDTEWSYAGELRNDVTFDDDNTTPDFSDELQDVLDDNLLNGPETVSAPLKLTSSAETEIELNSLEVVYTPPLEKVTVINATSEAFHLVNCAFYLINCTALSSSIGINAIGSQLSIFGSTILDTNVTSIGLSGSSEAVTYDTVFDRESLSIADSSDLTVRWGFDLHVQNQNLAPAQSKTVRITDWSENQVFYGTTNAYGDTSSQVLTEFEQTSAQRTYETPHRIIIYGDSSDNLFCITAEAHKSLAIFWDGDSDNDSVKDIDEHSQFMWTFEAETRAYQSGHIVFDSYAVGNASVNQSNAGDIFDEDLAKFHAGSYKVYYRAKQTVSNTIESINISVSSGQTTFIPTITKNLTNNTIYNWLFTDQFNITTDSILHVNISDANLSGSYVLLDRILVLQTNDSSGNPTFYGNFSDPLQLDSDGDELSDGHNLTVGGITVHIGENSTGTMVMDPDTDHDLLPDGMEVTWYFGTDRIETEDYIFADNQTDHQFSVTLCANNTTGTLSPSWENLSMPISAEAQYRITISGSGIAELYSINETLPAWLDQQYQFVLRAANISIYHSGNVSKLQPSYENRSWHHIKSNTSDYKSSFYYFWFYIGEFNFTSDEYTVEIRVNESPFFLPYDVNMRRLNITTDYLRVERMSANPLMQDCDGDSVTDGEEVNHGCYLWNPDADEDGLSDAQELNYGTDPGYRDSDFDGLRDRIELGLTGETNSFTVWDTNSSRGSKFELESRNPSPPPIICGYWSNNDSDAGLTTSDPNKCDSDSDGLPDGCIDGWTYNITRDEWGRFNDTYDNIHNFWEGEDLDLNGATSSGEWSNGSGCGETNSSTWDTDADNMPDSWEAWYRINPLNSGPSDGTEYELDDMVMYNSPWDFQPRLSGLSVDGLPNYYEYIACTNPRLNDTDFDSAIDGVEVYSVILRTDVPNGAWQFDAYKQTDLTNSTIQFKDKLFNYSEERNWTDPVPLVMTLFGGYVATNLYLQFFDEYSYICYNKTANEIQVTKMTRVGQIIEFNSFIFDYKENVSENNNKTDRHQEVYRTDPNNINSDGILLAGRIDLKYGINDSDGPEDYGDEDNDGLVNARDIDSDGDWIQDPIEHGYGNWAEDLDGDQKCNMLDNDSDADGLNDTVEYLRMDTTIPTYDPGEIISDGHRGNYAPYDPDCDDDGLLDGWNITAATGDYHWNYFSSATHSIAYVNNSNGTTTYMGEESIGTNWSDPDSDHDGLIDGNNRTVAGKGAYYGEFSVGTDPLDNDTDNDSLMDGTEVYGWPCYYEDLDGNSIAIRGHSDPRTGHIDSDLDGLNDSIEYQVSDGLNNDSDFDGLNDSKEMTNGTKLMDQDTDDDYLPDGAMDLDLDGNTNDIGEYEDKNCNGVFNETGETDPRLNDTDSDRVLDGLEYRVVRFRSNALNSTYGKRSIIPDPYDPFIYNRSNVWISADVGEESMICFYYLYNTSSQPTGNNSLLNYHTPELYPLYHYPTYHWLVMQAGNNYFTFNEYIDQNYFKAETVPHSTGAFWSRETGEWLSDPKDPTTDSDGLNDGQELYDLSHFDTMYLKLMDVDGDNHYNTNDSDSDGDGIPDDQDLINGSTQLWWVDLDGDGKPCALDTDSDGDNLSDNVDPYPLGVDGDGDGIVDSMDPAPTIPDYDGDGILDGHEGGGNWSGDIDKDGRPNWNDPDSDGDGLADGDNTTFEIGSSMNATWGSQCIYGWKSNETHYTYLGESANHTDPLNTDSDRDGLWDGPNPTGVINYSGWMRLGKTRFYVMDGKAYGDYRYMNLSGFNLHTYGELSYGTNPTRNDTDNDSLTDGEEVCGYYPDDILIPKTDYINGSSYTAYYPQFSIDAGSWLTLPFYVDDQLSGLRFAIVMDTNGPQGSYQADINVKVTNRTNLTVAYANYTNRFSFGNYIENSLYPYISYGGGPCFQHTIITSEIPKGQNVINISVIAGTGQSGINILGNISILTKAFYGSNPASNDSDADGMNDFEETKLGTSIKRNDTDRDFWYDCEDDRPIELDVDGDYLSYQRERYFGTDYLDPDCDNDLLYDYNETMVWHSDPWNPLSDTDTLMDGYEVLGWDVYTITSREAIIRIEQAAIANQSFDQYITMGHVMSNPTIWDSDYDGMGDTWEFTCSTNPGNDDTDLDNIPDDMDFEKDIIETRPPDVRVDCLKPANSLTVNIWVNVSDPSGLYETEATIGDEQQFAYFEVGFKESHRNINYQLKVAEALKMPYITVYSEDCFGNGGNFSMKIGQGAFDQAENFFGRQMGRAMGPLHGGITAGFVTAFLDTIYSTTDMISKLGSGKNMEAIGKISTSFAQNGLGPFQQMIDGVYQQEEEQNPYNTQTESTQHEAFKWSWAAGYVFGMVVTAYAGAKGTGEIFAAGSGALTSAVVGDGLVAASGEIMSAAEVTANLAEWGARFAGLSRGAKTLIYIAIIVGASATLKYVFPELFSNWMAAGFGAVMCTQVITDHINIGISEGAMNKLFQIIKKYPTMERALKSVSKYIKGGIGKEDTEIIINNIERIADLSQLEDPSVIYRYVKGARAAGHGNPLSTETVFGLENEIIRITSAKNVRTFIHEEVIDGITVLRRGHYNPTTKEGWGQFYYQGKHVDGTIIKYQQDGVTPRYNSFYPTGKSISGGGYTFHELPNTMTVAQVDDLVCEAAQFGWPDSRPGNRFIRYLPDKYGIDEMIIELGEDGSIMSSYPISGPSVMAWNPDHPDKWVNVIYRP